MTLLQKLPDPMPHDCNIDERPEPANVQPESLWMCPACGKWWHSSPMRQGAYAAYVDSWWSPVCWYHVAYRKRIAAHESAVMHNRCPGVSGDIRWWNV